MQNNQGKRLINPYTVNYFIDIKRVLDAGKTLSALNGTTILITGATGLIGSAIVDLLICLNECFRMSINIVLGVRDLKNAHERFYPYTTKQYLKIVMYHAKEINNFDELKIDYIIHAAGNAHPSVLAKEPVETMEANFIGLYNLLNYATNATLSKIVYISSSEIYGNYTNRDRKPLSEDDYGILDILNVRSCYPSSKRASETLLISFMEEYNINANIVRPGHIYGPTQSAFDSRASAQFLSAAARGHDIVMKSRGEQLRSYCHCFDCAAAILHVLLFGNMGEAYNISNSNSIVTIREFAEACARIAGCRVILENATACDAKSYNMMPFSALDSQKVESIGWHSVYNLSDGVAESINILKNLI